MTPLEQAIEDARRAGFDLNLIDSNLALNPEERMLRHASALELAQALREAGAQGGCWPGEGFARREELRGNCGEAGEHFPSLAD